MLDNKDGFFDAKEAIFTRQSEIQAKIEAAKEKIKYNVVKGDPIDVLFGAALIRAGCKVLVTRLAAGSYMFGQKKIMAKIINGKLVIRVGGGYMSADEFIE